MFKMKDYGDNARFVERKFISLTSRGWQPEKGRDFVVAGEL